MSRKKSFNNEKVYAWNCVREYRLKAGLSQDALADLCGTSKTTINAIEHFQYDYSCQMALRIALVLNVPFDVLFRLDVKFPESQ